MFVSVLSIDGSVTLEAALGRLAGYGDEEAVVVRVTGQFRSDWYRTTLGRIRAAIEESAVDRTVSAALDLGPPLPVLAAEMVDRTVEPDEPTLVIANRMPVGLIEPEALELAVGDDWMGGTVAAEGGADEFEVSAVGGNGEELAEMEEAPVGGVELESMPAARASADDPPSAAIDSEFPGGTSPSDETHFSAFPRFDAPGVVVPKQAFEVVVGLQKEQQAGTGGTAMILPTEQPRFDMEVQLVAPGFDVPGGVRRTFEVDRANLEGSVVRFDVVAPDQPQLARITIEFSHGGSLTGMAWRDIAVAPAGAAVDVALEEGSSAVASADPMEAADLVVSINFGAEETGLVWTFTTRHDVTLPAGVVETAFDEDDARSFALKRITTAGEAEGSQLIDEQVMGIARLVADAMPNEFWEVLGGVWARVGDVPSVLLISADPFVPWELASTEDRYVDPALVDADRPTLLGAQVRVGRWAPPGPKPPRGPQRPALPPPTAVRVAKMALVIGDYLETAGVRPLPEARQEGEALAARYPSVKLTATEDDLDDLLEDELEESGEPVAVDAIHFSCHGLVDANNPARNGIVLSDAAPRLNSVMIYGSKIGKRAEPFVFLNACQLAQIGVENLGDYGGMAGAFLQRGAAGFVAPLWAVRDTVAREVAEEFYRLTIEEGVVVGEALRRIRGRFDSAENVPSTTYLAYTYYGHPDLTFTTG